jgi:hypothetical protein
MIIKEFAVAATPKSRTKKEYILTATTVYEEPKPSTVVLPEQKEDGYDTQIIFTELRPAVPTAGALYINPVTQEITVWDEEEDVWITIANVRIWSGIKSNLPATGKSGWLYIETNTQQVAMWTGTAYKYLSSKTIAVGTGISKTETDTTITITNTGVTKAIAGSGITVSPSAGTGQVTIAVKVATSTAVGVVKPDNSTITIAPDGTLTATGGGGGGVQSIDAGTNIAVEGSATVPVISFSGILPIDAGGTNSSTKEGARTALEICSITSYLNSDQNSFVTRLPFVAWEDVRVSMTTPTESGNFTIRSGGNGRIISVTDGWYGIHPPTVIQDASGLVEIRGTGENAVCISVFMPPYRQLQWYTTSQQLSGTSFTVQPKNALLIQSGGTGATNTKDAKVKLRVGTREFAPKWDFPYITTTTGVPDWFRVWGEIYTNFGRGGFYIRRVKGQTALEKIHGYWTGNPYPATIIVGFDYKIQVKIAGAGNAFTGAVTLHWMDDNLASQATDLDWIMDDTAITPADSWILPT